MSRRQPGRHGGVRPGAGRPAWAVAELRIRFAQEHLDAIDEIREREGLTSRAEAVRWAIMRTTEAGRR